MKEDWLRSTIAVELKELRKGTGLRGIDLTDRSLIGVAFDLEAEAVASGIEVELAGIGSDAEANALRNAFGLPAVTSQSAGDLTSRRRDYAKSIGVSERTLSRYEDDAIEKLVIRLTRLFQTSPYSARIDGDTLVGSSERDRQTRRW